MKHKNILITGAGKGIGFSTANLLHSEGAFVTVIVRDRNDNKKLRKLRNIKIYNGNINNEKLIKKIFRESIIKKRIITGLVNNAGIRLRKDFNKISQKELLQIFNTNFFSIFKIMQIYSKYLISLRRKGSIVNIGSIVGQNGFEQLSAYGSTKGALLSLTKSFAVEMSKFNIRANVVSPGFTKTSYFENFKKNKKKIYNWTLSRTPLNRWAEPHEISKTILFLLSESSSYITGENINVDGGWLSS